MQINKNLGNHPNYDSLASARPLSKPATSPSSASSNSAEPLKSLAQIQHAASASRTTRLAASYSTTAGGKNYSGSVEELGGTYVASVPNPPPVSAIGSSVQSAESNLNMALDALA